MERINGIKKLTDNTLTVFDPISKCEYIFIRTDINSLSGIESHFSSHRNKLHS